MRKVSWNFTKRHWSSCRLRITAIRLERVHRGIQADRAQGDFLSERGTRRSTVRAENHGFTDDSVLPGQLAPRMDRLPLLRPEERERLRTRVRSKQSRHVPGMYTPAHRYDPKARKSNRVIRRTRAGTWRSWLYS